MSDFSEMTAAQQKELCEKVADCLKANGLGSTPVSLYREEVCQLGGSEHQGRLMLKVAQELPSTEAEKAAKFNEAVKDIVDGVKGVSINVSAIVGPGDMYQTITNVTTIADASKTVDIKHEAGEVFLIDFWATWCPPCQAPMAHNQKMLEEHGDKWGDKVKIIGLSIDNDAATVAAHVQKKGWEKPIHYHRAGSDYGKTYKVNGVPHVMLVDTTGKIVFKGHPANRPDLAADLNALLAGETITGEGCAPAKAAEGEEPALEEGFRVCTDDDLAGIHGEMDAFKNETSKALQEACKG